MSDLLTRLRGLNHCIHYHQAAGRHPVPRLIATGRELVEVVTGGRGGIELADGTWREVVPGDLLWQVAGDRTIGRSDFRDPYRCLAVDFKVAPGLARPVERLTRWEDLAELRTLTRQSVIWAADARLDRMALAAALYGRLLTEAQRWRLGAAALGVPEPVNRVRAQIDARCTEDLPVERLAREAGWSPQHLHAMFRRHLGISPHQYLMERRLQVARELLAGSDEPVAAVAVRAGFATAAVFCRAFRRAMGTSPGVWRRTRG